MTKPGLSVGVDFREAEHEDARQDEDSIIAGQAYGEVISVFERTHSDLLNSSR